jgi:TldD protein
MERLLATALARGGGFVDLYFEHETTSSLFLEEGIIRSASAGVTCGLGVRVVSGERTGYAYTDDLSFAAMARAAETAAHIAHDARAVPPQPVSPAPVERRYGETSVGVLSLAERIALVERADRAARAADPRIEKASRRGACGSRARSACWSRTCSRSSRFASASSRARRASGARARPAAAAGSGPSSSPGSRPSTSRARRRAWR